jgi:hypothetical protein
MNDELRFFLAKGPTTVKELARLTGMSVSTIYKAIKHVDVISHGGKPEKFSVNATTEDVAEPQAANAAPSNPTAAAPVVAPATSPAKRGRKPTAQGKKLFPSDTLLGGDAEPLAYINPRRKKSHGYRSLQIVIDNPGITTEDYLAKGGRLNDLAWDIKHGNVKAE